MKKTLSIILAVIMALTACVCAFTTFAADGLDTQDDERLVCTCADCTKISNGCHCCAACPYLDETYLVSCARNTDGHFRGSFCCFECTGIWPCDCRCGCAACANKDDTPEEFKPIFDEQQQEQIVNGFQALLKKISDIFDKFFDTIFEFLRFGEIFG